MSRHRLPTEPVEHVTPGRHRAAPQSISEPISEPVCEPVCEPVGAATMAVTRTAGQLLDREPPLTPTPDTDAAVAAAVTGDVTAAVKTAVASAAAVPTTTATVVAAVTAGNPVDASADNAAGVAAKVGAQVAAEVGARAVPRHRTMTAAPRFRAGTGGGHRRARVRRPVRVPAPRVLIGGALVSSLAVVSAAALTNTSASTTEATGNVDGTDSDRAGTGTAAGPVGGQSRTDSRVSRRDRTAIAGAMTGSRTTSAAAAAGVDTETVVAWALPVTAPVVSSCFGVRGGEDHQGADLPKPLGTPIYAVAAGRVVAAGPASGFGYRVVIEHAGGVTSTYGHMRVWDVEVGQQVAAGQQIALVGNEGQSTGPHVHVEIRQQGRTVDPSLFLRERGVDLGSD